MTEMAGMRRAAEKGSVQAGDVTAPHVCRDRGSRRSDEERYADEPGPSLLDMVMVTSVIVCDIEMLPDIKSFAAGRASFESIV